MKKILTAAAVVALSSATAFAADLPARTYTKAPMESLVYSWTGFYIGGHVGSGWGTTSTNVNVGGTTYAVAGGPSGSLGGVGLTVPIGQTQMNGFLGGGQVGYNWQSGMMVYGLEGDITWSGIKGSTACILLLNCTSEVKWMADITGRVGVTVGDRGLVYIKGGAAWADSTYGVNQSIAAGALGFGVAASLNGAVSNTRLGGVLGTGIEYGFMPGWSAKLEYDYYDFGKANLTLPVAAVGTVTGLGTPLTGSIALRLPINVNQQVHTIRVGANYHFNSSN
jgi:outer membrane immunogenic protein